MVAPSRTLLVCEVGQAHRLCRAQSIGGTGPEIVTSLTLVRCIKAPPHIVFEAVTTPEGMAHWWGPDAGPVLLAESDPRVGGCYRVRFRKLTGTEHECNGEFLV